MEMVRINRDLLALESSLNQDTTWEELATVINFATKLQGAALEVAIKKGLAEGMYQSEIIEKLRESGCTLTDRQLFRSIEFHAFKIELSNTEQGHKDLKIPETEAQFRQLDGQSALEKAELFTDMYDSEGKAPTRDSVDRVKQMVAKAKEAAKKQIAEDHRNTDMPEYLSPEQMVSFDEWFVENVGMPRNEVKPKVNFSLIANNRDVLLQELSSKSDDWKYARKKLFNFSHPDKGGDTIVFQFIDVLDKLMKELINLVEYGKYQLTLDMHKKDWWSSLK